jgi:hypothetical protein
LAPPLPAPTSSAATPGPSASPSAGPSTSPSAGPSPGPSALPTASSSATPNASPLPGGASPAPTPAASPAPTAAPTPVYHFKFVPPVKASPNPADPQILEVDLNSQTLHGTIAMRILTNAVVTKVITRSNGQSGTVPQIGPGAFAATGSVPKLPIKITLEFVASTADGRSTSVKIPVKL